MKFLCVRCHLQPREEQGSADPNKIFCSYFLGLVSPRVLDCFLKKQGLELVYDLYLEIFYVCFNHSWKVTYLYQKFGFIAISRPMRFWGVRFGRSSWSNPDLSRCKTDVRTRRRLGNLSRQNIVDMGSWISKRRAGDPTCRTGRRGRRPYEGKIPAAKGPPLPGEVPDEA